MIMIGSTIGMQAALALNNIGVSLLERGCYREGMEVLQDGIRTMKSMFKASEDSTDDVTDPSNDPLEKLHKARDKASQVSSQVIDTSSTAKIKTLSFQVDGLSGVLEHLGKSPSSTFYLVRMDIPLECAVSVSNTPDLESAVLLYNFGMAQLLISSVISNSQPMVENSHRILHLASSIVARRSNTCDDSLEEAALLQMGLLVLNGMIQVLIESGMDLAAATVFERYLKVREIVGSLEATTAWFSTLLVSAPAA